MGRCNMNKKIAKEMENIAHAAMSFINMYLKRNENS